MIKRRRLRARQTRLRKMKETEAEATKQKQAKAGRRSGRIRREMAEGETGRGKTKVPEKGRR